jgi:hypothetical protein
VRPMNTEIQASDLLGLIAIAMVLATLALVLP